MTLPTAGWLLSGHGLAPMLLVGLAPAVPYLLIVTLFALLYVVTAVLAIRTTMSRVRNSDRPSDDLDRLFVQIANAAIAVLTLEPLKLKPAEVPAARTKPSSRGRRYRRSTAAPAALPRAKPGDREDIFWHTLQSQAERPGGTRDIVDTKPGDTQPETDTEPISKIGRHARPEPDLSTRVPSRRSPKVRESVRSR